jgi:hypothetical protein
MKVLFFFVDGLGLGEPDPQKNPCTRKEIRHLTHVETGEDVIPLDKGFRIAAEATLGVEGLPQSATGTATILTGINCSQHLKKHLPGFPNESLRDILKDHSLLKQVNDLGCRSAFLNAYRPLFFKLKEKTRWRLSATTVANLAAGNPFYQYEDITSRTAIFHDYTNEQLIKRGIDMPRFGPEEAADILIRSQDSFHLILYEYFLTDRAAHTQRMDVALPALERIDALVHAVLDRADLNQNLVLLASDHGNIEDLSVKAHTRNRVPVLVWGRHADFFTERISTIQDITPALMEFFRMNVCK